MFNSSFYERIKNHNQTINIINCALRKLEKDIICYVEDHPEVTLYSYDPLIAENTHYFQFDYPNVFFSLPPLKITITYKEIIERIDGHLNNCLFIEQTIEKIILDHITLL